MNRHPRLIIAGSHGFVGARAMERYPDAIPVPSSLLRDPGQELREFIRAQQPELILNAAAISDIGACQQNPEGSYLANVVLPVELAKAAQETGAKLVSFSSDQVYTGCTEEGPYRECLDLPTPANLYARHKLEAEQQVLELHPDGVMLRATWMYDMPMYHHPNRGNFLVNTLSSLAQGKSIPVPARQYRGITYVRQVAALMDQVFTLPGGVYNYGSENPLTMPETVQALLDALGAEGRIHLVDGERHNLWMDCGKIKKQSIFFDTTSEGFRRCVRDYGLV